MRATVIAEYEDMVDGKRHKPGDSIDIDAARAVVLRKAGVIGAINPGAPPTPETATLPEPETATPPEPEVTAPPKPETAEAVKGPAKRKK